MSMFPIFSIMLYINPPANQCSAMIEQDYSVGAIGSNWQIGPEFLSRKEAEDFIIQWRAEMEAGGYEWTAQPDHAPRF